jgi:hypothetical protein
MKTSRVKWFPRPISKNYNGGKTILSTLTGSQTVRVRLGSCKKKIGCADDRRIVPIINIRTTWKRVTGKQTHIVLDYTEICT